MKLIKSIYHFFKSWFVLWKLLFKTSGMEKEMLQLKVVALQSQLLEDMEKRKKYNLPKRQYNLAFKQLWTILSKILPDWKGLLYKVQPETVIRWHRTVFRLHWKRKSKKIGRPTISKETIEFIKKLHTENAYTSPEKIHYILKLQGVIDAPAPNTIAKYIKEDSERPKPPTTKQIQSWKTFLQNHADVTWAADFFTIPTLTLKVLHVLVVIHHKTRKIIYFNVTTNPNADWVVQQFRNITPYGRAPKYLIHDNDPLFKAKKFQRFLKTSNIHSKPTTYRSPWQNPYVERVIGTLKRECTDHIIPLNEKHISNHLADYIHNYYNTNRPHESLDGQTPVPTPTHLPIEMKETKLKAIPVMNGIYHTYRRSA